MILFSSVHTTLLPNQEGKVSLLSTGEQARNNVGRCDVTSCSVPPLVSHSQGFLPVRPEGADREGFL
jgi:hypothetical protein